MGRLAVIREDVFGDPEVSAADDALNGEPFRARLFGQHRVVAVDGMLRVEVAGIGRGPMAIQRASQTP
jgi:hypothetical protein